MFMTRIGEAIGLFKALEIEFDEKKATEIMELYKNFALEEVDIQYNKTKNDIENFESEIERTAEIYRKVVEKIKNGDE